MASLRVHPDRLEISLSTAEKSLSRRREDIVVQRYNIRSVTITDDPWIWIRGIRAPGTIVPLVLAVGTWKFHGGKDFLAVKSKRQAVVIDLVDEEFARVILTTQHAPDLIASLKLTGSELAAESEAAVEAAAAAAGAGSAAKPKAKPKAKPRAKPKSAPKSAPASAPKSAPAPKPAPKRATRAKAAKAKAQPEVPAEAAPAEAAPAEAAPAETAASGAAVPADPTAE